MVQHLNGGLRLDDKVADQHAQRNEQPAPRRRRQRLSQRCAHRGKAHVHAAQEEHQPHIGIEEAHQDLADLPRTVAAADELKYDEHPGDGQEGGEHLRRVAGHLQRKHPGHIPGRGHLGHVGEGIAGLTRIIEAAQHQHRQHRPHAAQRHETEAVVPGAFVAADAGQTDAHGHDERNGDRAGGHAAGVEGHRQEIRRDKKREHDQPQIEAHQQHGQANLQQNAQDRQRQKDAHAHRHGEHKHPVRNGGHLIGQHLQIGLRHRDDRAHQEADAQNDRQATAFRQFTADAFPHGGHGDLRAQLEESHPHNEHQRPYKEHDHRAQFQRHQQHADPHDDQRDRHHCGQ